MLIPMVGFDGVRQTVNANLTPTQTVWNLRSALNVAALNCLSFEHQGLLDNYGTFLDIHSDELSAANKALQTEFRERHGTEFQQARDRYMTQVYNYYALPPVQDAFCDTALNVSSGLLIAPAGNLAGYAPEALSEIETVFTDFFDSYEQYRRNVVAWDARWGRPINASASGFVDPFGDVAGTGTTDGVVSTLPSAQTPASTASQSAYPAIGTMPGSAPAYDEGPSFVSQPVTQGQPETVAGSPVPAPEPDRVDSSFAFPPENDGPAANEPVVPGPDTPPAIESGSPFATPPEPEEDDPNGYGSPET